MINSERSVLSAIFFSKHEIFFWKLLYLKVLYVLITSHTQKTSRQKWNRGCWVIWHTVGAFCSQQHVDWWPSFTSPTWKKGTKAQYSLTMSGSCISQLSPQNMQFISIDWANDYNWIFYYLKHFAESFVLSTMKDIIHKENN